MIPENRYQAMEIDQVSHPVSIEETTHGISIIEGTPQDMSLNNPEDTQDIDMGRLSESRNADPTAQVESTESVQIIDNQVPTTTRPTKPESIPMDVDMAMSNATNNGPSNEISKETSLKRSTSEPPAQAVKESTPTQVLSQPKLEEDSPPLHPPKIGQSIVTC